MTGAGDVIAKVASLWLIVRVDMPGDASYSSAMLGAFVSRAKAEEALTVYLENYRCRIVEVE